MNFWEGVRETCLWCVIVMIVVLQIFTYRMSYYTADKMVAQEAGLQIVAFAATQALAENRDILDLTSKLVTVLPDVIDTRISIEKNTVAEAEKIARMNLRESTVMIKNLSLGAQGSGVMIKVDGQIRILSAGHMIENVDDEFVVTEQGRDLDHLKVVNVNKSTDLLLLEFVDPEHITSVVRPLEVAETSPVASSPVILVGSPIGIEDLYSEGKVVGYVDNYIYFFDHVYFGSSGGGVFNSDGQLIGIISHMMPVQVNGLTFVIHAASNLTRIHELLADSAVSKTPEQLKKLLLVEMSER